MALNSLISYTESGIRKWVEVNGSGVVVNKGNCVTVYETRIWKGIRNGAYANFSSEDVVGQSKAGIITSNSMLVYSSTPLTDGSRIFTDSTLTTPFSERVFFSDGVKLYCTSNSNLIFNPDSLGSVLISELNSFPFYWSSVSAAEACAGTSTFIWGFNSSPTLVSGLYLNYDTSSAIYLSTGGNVYSYEYILGITAINTCAPLPTCTISITFYNTGNSNFEIQSFSDYALQSDINVTLRVYGDITGNVQDIYFTIPSQSTYYSTQGTLSGFSGQDLITSGIQDYTPTGDSSLTYVIQYIA